MCLPESGVRPTQKVYIVVILYSMCSVMDHWTCSAMKCVLLVTARAAMGWLGTTVTVFVLYFSSANHDDVCGGVNLAHSGLSGQSGLGLSGLIGRGKISNGLGD